MLFTSFLFSVLLASALALPTESSSELSAPPMAFGSLNITSADRVTDRDLGKRQEGGVYITTDIGWGGITGYAKQPWDECIRLDSPWYHTISSLGPDSGNAVIYSEDYDCNNPGGTMFSPGNSDLRNIGWSDRIGSFVVRQVAVVNNNQCIYDLGPAFPGVNCNSCCNGCDRSGTDCCPAGLYC